MPKIDRLQNRIPTKLPKRITTINDLLASDEINTILSALDKEKPNIVDLIVIITNKEGDYSWTITKHSKTSTATWMLESTKLDILSDDSD